MSNQDPFQNLGQEHTIIKPRLGRGAGNTPQAATSQNAAWPDLLAQQPAPSGSRIEPGEWLRQLQARCGWSNNVLINQAMPFLLMGANTRLNNVSMSPEALSQHWRRGLDELDRALGQAGHSHTERMSLRYLLCTFLDEMAACTPWGGMGAWAPHSLLNQLFNETWGGEKCFALLERLMQNPSAHQPLLAVFLMALHCGFQGKYGTAAHHGPVLAQLRQQLHNLLVPTQAQATTGRPLWASKAPPPNRRLNLIPLWLPVAVCLLVCTGIFALCSLLLNGKSDPVFAQLASLNWVPAEAPQVTEPAPVVAGASLPLQLQEDIAAGLLTLKQHGNQSTIVLMSDTLFASGQGELNAAAVPLVVRVAKELASHPGRVTITGYTDNQPIRSLRFPSNWQLSAERARHVGELMAPHLPNFAMATEGAGEAQPIGDNRTAEGRARNRRVEITLIHHL